MDSQKEYRDQPPPAYPGGGPGPVPQAAPPTQVNFVQSAPVCIQSNVMFGEYSVGMQCPHCHGAINTRITHQAGLLTWLVAGGVCLVGGFLGCCLIPFCLDFCLDVVHSCPNCNHQLGVYQRIH